MKPHLGRYTSGCQSGEFICGQMQKWAVTAITWMESVSQEEAERGSVCSAKQQER